MPPEETPATIAVALSGGGHRATLFGLGVLLALVDRGLNRRISQIASVSGGSIVNGFIATHCDFQNTDPDSFDDVAADLVHRVVHQGILTPPVIIVFLGIVLIPPPLFLWLAYQRSISLELGLILAAASICLGLLRGLAIEWLLELRYFPPELFLSVLPPRLKITRRRLGGLAGRHIGHSMCCTDLAAYKPVYFSSGGQLISQVSGGYTSRSVRHVSIASVVRASAAFPGIPPRRFRFVTAEKDFEAWVNREINPEFDPNSELRKTMFLADGGIWNNLGTQALREGTNWLRIKCDIPLIVADASAEPGHQRLWPYYIPVWSLMRSLFRAVDIQHSNTVEPRLLPMQIERGRRITEQVRMAAGLPPHQVYEPKPPFDIPVRLRGDPDYVRNFLNWNVDYPRDLDKPTDQGLASIKKVGFAFMQSPELLEAGNRPVAGIGTHLGRIHHADAVGLLAKGYLNTFLWTVELKPYDAAEIDRLATVLQRMTRMAA